MSKWAKFCGFVIRSLGWKVDGGVAPEKYAVLLVVPHTSFWDFIICYFYYTSLGAKTHTLGNKKFYVWPFRRMLDRMGVIPMDPRNPIVPVKKMIDRMKSSDEKFHLALSPEGTRQPVKKWKTGYHTIARELDCPVYLGHIDWGTKHIGYTEKFTLTDDPRKDTDAIQAYYEKAGYKARNPELFITR